MNLLVRYNDIKYRNSYTAFFTYLDTRDSGNNSHHVYTAFIKDKIRTLKIPPKQTPLIRLLRNASLCLAASRPRPASIVITHYSLVKNAVGYRMRRVNSKRVNATYHRFPPFSSSSSYRSGDFLVQASLSRKIPFAARTMSRVGYQIPRYGWVATEGGGDYLVD